jgi:hypothetical protein
MVHRDDIILMYEESHRQAADIYTKAFTNPDKWRAAHELISIFAPDVLKCIVQDPSDRINAPAFQVPPQVALQRVEEIPDYPIQGEGRHASVAAALVNETGGGNP